MAKVKDKYSDLGIKGLSDKVKSITIIVTVISTLIGAAWATYAVPAVKRIVKKEVKPIKENVHAIVENSEDTKFAVDQIRAILNKTIDSKIIEAVERETAMFNPALKRKHK